MAGGFSDYEFLDACAELKESSVRGQGWELLVETMGVRIYRRWDKETGLYEYKVLGVLNVPPAVLADVYMDLDYRKQWDDYVEELRERRCNGHTVVYWQVRYPSILSNRDYVYMRERRELDVEGRKFHVVLAESTSHSQFPERSGVVRVRQYKQRLAITSDGSNGSKVFMYCFDNPGGQVPSWLINWAVEDAVPQFIRNLVRACGNYRRRN